MQVDVVLDQERGQAAASTPPETLVEFNRSTQPRTVCTITEEVISLPSAEESDGSSDIPISGGWTFGVRHLETVRADGYVIVDSGSDEYAGPLDLCEVPGGHSGRTKPPCAPDTAAPMWDISISSKI